MMILRKHDTGSYRTTTWAWWSECDMKHRLSPNFHSEHDALEWREIIFDIVKTVITSNH
jgi:hypothetical protein